MYPPLDSLDNISCIRPWTPWIHVSAPGLPGFMYPPQDSLNSCIRPWTLWIHVSAPGLPGFMYPPLDSLDSCIRPWTPWILLLNLLKIYSMKVP